MPKNPIIIDPIPDLLEAAERNFDGKALAKLKKAIALNRENIVMILTSENPFMIADFHRTSMLILTTLSKRAGETIMQNRGFYQSVLTLAKKIRGQCFTENN